MAGFRFKLDAVLRHRHAIERDKLRLYSAALADFKALEDQLKDLDRVMRDTNDDVRRHHLTGPLNIGFITAHRRFLLGIRGKAAALAAAMTGAQKQVDAARLALAQAARERKVLEKLREKQEQRWKDEVSRKEMIAADEVGMQMVNDAGRGRAA